MLPPGTAEKMKAESNWAKQASGCAVAHQDELERVKENNCVPIVGYGLAC